MSKENWVKAEGELKVFVKALRQSSDNRVAGQVLCFATPILKCITSIIHNQVFREGSGTSLYIKKFQKLEAHFRNSLIWVNYSSYTPPVLCKIGTENGNVLCFGTVTLPVPSTSHPVDWECVTVQSLFDNLVDQKEKAERKRVDDRREGKALILDLSSTLTPDQRHMLNKMKSLDYNPYFKAFLEQVCP